MADEPAEPAKSSDQSDPPAIKESPVSSEVKAAVASSGSAGVRGAAEGGGGESIDTPVPKIPYGRGMKFSGPQLFRIGMTVVTLVGVIVLTRPCSEAVSNFVMSYEGKETKMVKPGTVDLPTDQYERLKPGMTDEEIKAVMERAKAKNAARAGTAGSGSATDKPAP